MYSTVTAYQSCIIKIGKMQCLTFRTFVFAIGSFFRQSINSALNTLLRALKKHSFLECLVYLNKSFFYKLSKIHCFTYSLSVLNLCSDICHYNMLHIFLLDIPFVYKLLWLRYFQLFCFHLHYQSFQPSFALMFQIYCCTGISNYHRLSGIEKHSAFFAKCLISYLVQYILNKIII
nr:MAG TPA: hypothetical protein [Caudoviricetes sp.]